MADSVQEAIVKKITAALGQITTANGYSNTIASVQRYHLSGVETAVVPTIVVKEGECVVELGQSVHPSVRRRMEVVLVPITRHDEDADPRSGGEILNSLVADIERCVATNRTWDGLAIQTDPPNYLETELEAVEPHLSKGLRFEVLYEHVRTDPYVQV
jgi:hypothetical protein